MALKKFLVLDGVVAVCRFRDDGEIMDAAGLLPQELLDRLAHFAQWYRRMVSGNIDLLSLFSQMGGWSPAQGWIVRGPSFSVCGSGNMVCMIENDSSALNNIMRMLNETAHE